MGQELTQATACSPLLASWLRKIEAETPGSSMPVPSNVRADAMRAAEAIDQAMTPAPAQTVERWLAALATLVAGQMTADDARQKIQAYAAMLSYPRHAYSRASLHAAARASKWFPAYAELCVVLDAEVAEAKALRHQLRRLVAMPVAAPAPAKGRWSDLSDEQRAELARVMASFRGQHGQAQAQAG